jgi:hypothetical protein
MLNLLNKSYIGGVLLCLLLVPQAQAQLSLVITPSTVDTIPGETLTFSALLTNVGGEPIDLTTSFGSFPGPTLNGIVWNDIDFFNNLPLTLTSGGTYQADLFAEVAPTASVGAYNGNYTVEGTGTTTTTNYSVITPVSITVTPAIPEPSTLMLLGMGAVAGTLGKIRQRKKLEKK